MLARDHGTFVHRLNLMTTSATFAISRSDTFSMVHARDLASKVTTDMTRCHQLYRYPATLAEIDNFGTELALWLKAGYVARYEFGFKKGDQRVLSWLYEVKGTSLEGGGGRPGGLQAGVDITGAVSFNQLTPSQTYFNLKGEEKEAFDRTLPLQRGSGKPPTDGLGAWIEERDYFAAGTLVHRRSFRPN